MSLSQLPYGLSPEDVINTAQFKNCYDPCYEDAFNRNAGVLSINQRKNISKALCTNACVEAGIEGALNNQINQSNLDTTFNEKNTVALVKIGVGIVLALVIIVFIFRQFRS